MKNNGNLKICRKDALSYVTFIDCFDFVNHEEKYFADLVLHPNDLGFALFAENLCKKVKERFTL